MTQQTAQGLASLGRGPDSMLVHMAPSEVAGLQALALKNGGSLTINPETGLPEAGFLSKILPMVLGAGAMMIPGLQGLGAGWIGAGIGGLTTLATGSLKKGLMAGLGAYGGAGLTGALTAGATTVPSAVGTVVPQSVAPVAEMGAASAAEQTAINNALASNASAAAPVAAPVAAPIAAPVAAPVAAPTSANMFGTTTDEIANAYGFNAAPVAPTVAPVAPPPAATVSAVPTATPTTPAITNPLDVRLEAGQATTPLAQTTREFLNANKYPIAALGIAALDQDPKAAPEDTPGMIRPFTYSREKVPSAFEDVAGAPLSSKERRYFTDKYTALTPYKAPGPEYMAEGGPVEDMSDANAIGMNTGYPQADIRTGAYATPYQQPISRDVVTGSQFAGGGSINLQGTFSSGDGQGGGQTGSSNNPQPFIGNNNAPSMMPQQGVTPMPGADFMPGPAVMPRGLQDLLKGPMSRGMAFAGGGSVSPNGGASSDGMLARLFAQANGQSGGSSVGGYTYDPVTQTYSSPSVGDVVPNAGLASSGLGGSIGGYTYNPHTQTYGRDAVAESTPAMAQGGISNLGDYSDGGRLLRGPGDGVSDNIPASIGGKQEARLADGEFVVPARIVSELGNGSTEAGARQLYAMMDRVQKARRKTVGKDKVATNSRAAKLLPA